MPTPEALITPEFLQLWHTEGSTAYAMEVERLFWTGRAMDPKTGRGLDQRPGIVLQKSQDRYGSSAPVDYRGLFANPPGAVAVPPIRPTGPLPRISLKRTSQAPSQRGRRPSQKTSRSRRTPWSTCSTAPRQRRGRSFSRRRRLPLSSMAALEATETREMRTPVEAPVRRQGELALSRGSRPQRPPRRARSKRRRAAAAEAPATSNTE